MSLIQAIEAERQPSGQRNKIMQTLSREQRQELDKQLLEINALADDCPYTWAQIARGVCKHFELPKDSISPASISGYARRVLSDG